MKFHVFYTDNLPEQITRDHAACCQALGLSVQYHCFPTPENFHAIYRMHGDFMNRMMEEEKDEVVCFLDVDCLPHNIGLLDHLYQWVKAKRSFGGNAQCHFARRNHLYAAASCLMVSKKGYAELGKPDLCYFEDTNTPLIDTAQQLTLAADRHNLGYRLMYPIGYDDSEQRWELGAYGYYGRGTLYPATWHYFRISDFLNLIPNLWSKRVSDILTSELIIPNYPTLPYELLKYRFSWRQFSLLFKKRKRL